MASKKAFFIALILFPTYFVAQQSNNNTFSVARISISPLSAALGGSQVASYASDVNQLAVNPGLLDSTLDQSVSLGYLNYLADINQATIAYANMIDSFGLISGYFRYFDYGSFVERDDIGNEIGNFKVADYEVGVSLTRPYSQRVSYGVTLKQFFSGNYQYKAYGVAFDLGAYFNSKSGNFQAGLTVDDIGAKLVGYTDEGPSFLPVSMNIGIAKKFSKAPLRFGFQYNNLERWDLAANDADELSNLRVDPLTGESSRRVFTVDNFARHLSLSAAFVPSENVNLMIGYNFRRRLELAISERPGLVGFSFGAMIKVKRFNLQYAISSYHINGASNHIAVSTNLNEWYKKKTLN